MVKTNIEHTVFTVFQGQYAYGTYGPKDLEGNFNMTVADVLTTTTNGAGEAVFQTNAADEDFADEAE